MNGFSDSQIHEVRGRRVILDADLAEIYGVSTKHLNQQVKRNPQKFPLDFAFLLTVEEVTALRSQVVTSKIGRGGRRYRPWAFTEHGVVMAASVLNSPLAIEMSVFVVRVFVGLRRYLATRDELAKQLVQIERKLMRHDASLQEIFRIIRALRKETAGPPRRQIGFKPG